MVLYSLCRPHRIHTLMPAARGETLGGAMARIASILLFLFATHSPVAALDIKLPEEFAAPGNNLVKLRRIGANPAPAEAATDVKKYLNGAVTEDSRYTVALKSVEHAGANQYLTYEFLVWRNSGDRETTQIQFNLTTTGSFADFFKDVPFTVTDGVATALGELNIPVHPLDPTPQCRMAAPAPKSGPLPVFLSGDTDFIVSLDCGDAASIPRLVSLRGPRVGHRAYWESVVFESQYWGQEGPSAPLPTKSFDLLKATVTPNVLAAVGARFRRLNVKDDPDDTIVFDLTYAIQPGGREIPLKIEIPIVFFPFVKVIAGSLSSGVALGWGASCLLMLGVGQSKSWKDAGRALLLGLLLAVIAYTLALLAYSANCRLQLFGLELNPSDVLVLFALGLACGCVALLKLEELRKLVDRASERIMNLRGAATGSLVLLLVWGAPANAADGRLALVALSACPGGDVIGLHRDGTVIQFPGSSRGTWRPAGRLSSHFDASEITCATVDGRETAFVVAVSAEHVWAVRMDIATGRWRQGLVTSGFSAGIAFDPASNGVYVSSPKDRAIYRISAALEDPRQWASVFDKADSIGPLAVDSAGSRLLVGEAFSGIVYSLSLDSRRQGTVATGLGAVNSLGVDGRRNLVYIADSGRRTIWVVPLSGSGSRAPRVFYRSDELEGVTGVAVDGRSNVWVGVYSPAKVIVLRPDGRPLDVMR